jgi:uncharacterized membrane protein
MIGKSLIRKLVAGFAAAGAAFVAMVALGAAVFYALALVLPPLGAAALTFALFGLIALVIALFYLKDGGLIDDEEDDIEEADSLATRAVNLIRERPIIGAGLGLGALFFLVRNPALAAIVASMVTEKRMENRGYGKRRR